jgi:DNA-binding response OmpR family regulator
MKVLVVEDDDLTRDGLGELLCGEGYEVVLAADGEAALRKFESERPDFVCLDVMMPRMSGYEVCRHIRQHDNEIPIIFISAKSEEIDKVVGLELGADDFIVKPFGVKEVTARIRAVTRRCLGRQTAAQNVAFRMHDLEIRPAELRAVRGSQTIDLSLRDVQILRLLFEKRGQAVDRDTIFHICWGLRHVQNSRTLDQHISQLRKRVELDPKAPQLIRTVHGVGYRYDPD